MKANFFEHYPFTENEQKELWNKSIFCYDANILLTLYRVNPTLKNKILKSFELKIDSTILPYQAAKEFHENIFNVIDSQKKLYSNLIKILDECNKKIIAECEKFKDHPVLNTNQYKSNLNKIIDNEVQALKDKESKHDSECDTSSILDQITTLFKDKIAEPKSSDQIDAIIKEGRIRYEKQIPPGYMDDKGKKEPDKYGDLFIWKEIIDIANKHQCPIVFVTNDAKEDWIFDYKGQKIGPRPELRREFYNETKQHILIINISTFQYLINKYEKSNGYSEHDKNELQAIINENTNHDKNISIFINECLVDNIFKEYKKTENTKYKTDLMKYIQHVDKKNIAEKNNTWFLYFLDSYLKSSNKKNKSNEEEEDEDNYAFVE